MLLLKRHLVELVRAGKKRQTIRLWSRPLLRAGQISYTPGLGKMRITAVEQLPSLSALTESDALADGFASLKELLAEIRRIYGPKIPPGRSIYRIQFQWPEPPAAPPHVTPASLVKTPAVAHIAPRQNRTVKPRRARSAMTASQRTALRAFVIAHAP